VVSTIAGIRTPRRSAVCRAVLLAFIVLSGSSGLASAQAPPPPPPPKTEGSAEFAFVGTTGNTSTQTIGLGGVFIYRPSPWETKLNVSYVRSKAENVLSAQAFALTFRAQRPIGPRLSGYGQYGYQQNKFAGILDRHVVEAGLAYSLIEKAPHKLVVDAGLGYANEKRLQGTKLSTAILGAGGVYTWKISGTSELSEDGHFVFSLSNRSDWRYANALALTAKVTTAISLKLSHGIRYVNQPALGFKKTDALTSIALVAKF
jgi:putative salt-induced outer membrane protein